MKRQEMMMQMFVEKSSEKIEVIKQIMSDIKSTKVIIEFSELSK